MLGGAHLLVLRDLSLKPGLARPETTLRLVLHAETKYSGWPDIVLRASVRILCCWVTLLFPVNRSEPVLSFSLFVPEVRVTKTLLL